MLSPHTGPNVSNSNFSQMVSIFLSQEVPARLLLLYFLPDKENFIGISPSWWTYILANSPRRGWIPVHVNAYFFHSSPFGTYRQEQRVIFTSRNGKHTGTYLLGSSCCYGTAVFVKSQVGTLARAGLP